MLLNEYRTIFGTQARASSPYELVPNILRYITTCMQHIIKNDDGESNPYHQTAFAFHISCVTFVMLDT